MRLELRDLWAAPPGAPQPVLRGLSLDVTAGEWVAVGGENGCGKSTLLQVAAGLLPPLRGERRLGFDSAGVGRLGSEGTERLAPRVATVLQDPSVQLFAPTVAEEIGLTALHLGESPAWREARVRRLSALLGLEAELGLQPQALSAGRQQLVLLAAALASEPDLLVADEPCAHLDEATRRRVLEVLRDEVARGLAIVWATQSSEERAAASRWLSLGGEGAGPETGEPKQAEALPGREGSSEDAFLVLDVGPDPGTGGPCVRTPHPFRLELPDRGIVCFAGPNGAGKSVLLGSVCGLIQTPQIQVSRRETRFPALFVGQFPETQIFEEEARREMTFAAISRGISRAEALRHAEACLSRFGMAGRPDRHSWELSSGERRLVLLIGALTAPASVLALDEPTAGLDPARKATLASMVIEASADRLVLIASQDTSWARTLPGVRVTLPPASMPSSPSKKTD